MLNATQAKDLIDECGGTRSVSERLGVTSRSVVNWRKFGLSRANEMAIKGADPTAYERWKAKQQEK